MPPVDLETLVCGGDRKIACEIVIGDHHSPPDKPDHPEPPPDFPGESFQLRKVEELDWFDRNALYERKESHKGNANPSNNSNSISTSQRSRRGCRPARAPFFFKKPSRVEKSLAETEPSSPKVSCIGRIRSKKDKNRRCPSSRRPTETTPAEADTSNSKPEKKTGFWVNLKSIILNCQNGQAVDIEEPPKDSPSLATLPRWSFAERAPKIPANEPSGEPTGLGEMKRFTSGRRSETWANGIDLDSEDPVVVVVESDSPERRHNIFRRRVVDPPKKIDCVRDWQCVGPSSV
ncbi:hypothetical protein NE237_005428 [Protea cynaroides]|uniref:Uncharacterized protein n=1 Tax=Protea cynaroides TaxID=273540 RepID=A0A9Q0QUL9_9MAGN|nr:hypothetical protein NE237_005428 [Protea cynaroides]